MIAKVPCSKIVCLAKALHADGFATSNQEFVYQLSQVNPKDSESKVHQLLNQYGLSLPIPLRCIHHADLQGFPRLKPMDVFSYMLEAGHLNKLLGGKRLDSSRALLQEFWQNYKQSHEDFELFAHPDICFEDCIPILAHIDGGRGYKKSEFMVFNWGPILGSGAGKKAAKDPSIRTFRRETSKFHMALLGHSYTTHFLYAAMPSAWHKSNEDAFQRLLKTFSEDLRECFDEGLSYNGRVIRLVLLGLKGDLKMQARAGRLTRWFTTARKRPLDPSRPSKVTGECCWLCHAGAVDAPFEEIASENPAWLQKMDKNMEPPWEHGKEGGMLEASLSYFKQPAKFYLPDLFHIYLAGVGQDFGASGIVYMLPIFFHGRRGNSVDKQLEMLNEVFTLWRKMNKVPMNLIAFTRDRLTYPDATKVYPTGTWPKAADTPRIIQFMLYVLDLFPDRCARDADKILYYIKLAGESIGAFMQGLYKADLWIVPGRSMSLLHRAIKFILKPKVPY